MKKSKTKVVIFGSLRAMIVCSLMAALSIVFGKYLAIPPGSNHILRFSLENLPILLSGIMYGPAAGAAVGVVADLVGCVLVSFSVNPLITIGAASIGLLGGGVWWLFRLRRLSGLPDAIRLLPVVGLAHLVGSVTLKTCGLAAYYLSSFSIGVWQLVLLRLFNYAIVGAMEYAILLILLRNRSLRRMLRKYTLIDQGQKDA